MVYGLSSTKAIELLKTHGPNILPSQQPRSSLKIVLTLLSEPMITLLFIGGIIYLSLGDKGEALLLFLMIGFVVAITFAQEKKTENALAALKQLSSPRVKVIRDGITRIISGKELVPGDVVKVTEGDRIPGDGKIIELDSLQVDESILTGESLPIHKQNGDQVFSSTLVLSGFALITVAKTGVATKVGQIGLSLNTIVEGPTRIQAETLKIVRFFAFIGISVSILVVLLIGFKGGNWMAGILGGIAVAMSVMPEEFPLVITIFMALGAVRIGRHSVLTRNLPTIEILGSATVLCVDKTGTLTENQMKLTHVNPIGGFTEKQVREYASYACEPHLQDPMEKAIGTAAPHEFTLVEHQPLTKQALVMVNLWKSISTGQIVKYAKGSPEAIITICQLSNSEKKEIIAKVTKLADQGIRVIAVATADNNSAKFSFVGLLGFSDPLRKDVIHTLNQCTKAGIRVIMITGDHRETAVAIGKKLKLPGAEFALSGNEIDQMSIKQLQHRLMATSVCARITPQQKLTIVSALKLSGEIVAMTGDGVNDAPALKMAHIGIAMGQRGTDVAREASDLVLLDDSFSSIVAGIAEGRRIFDNIQKAISFIIAVHVPISIIALLPLLMGWPTILSPIHVIILEFIIDPACTLVFEAETSESQSMTRPPRPPKQKLFSRSLLLKSGLYGLVVSLFVTTAYLLSIHFGYPSEVIRTIAFLTLVLSDSILILTSRTVKDSFLTALKKPNPIFWVISGSVLIFIGAVITIPMLQHLMKLATLSMTEVSLILALCLGVFISLEAIKQVIPDFN